MLENSSCVAIYKTHNQAGAAVKELEKAGFDMLKLSIVGRGYHSDAHAIGFYKAGERVRFWGGQGAFWGGLWGTLVGAALFWLPGFGPLAVAGPLVGAIVTGFSGAAVTGSLGALGAALYSIGIPKDSIVSYEAALGADEFLLIAHGSEAQVRQASEILKMDDDVALHLS